MVASFKGLIHTPVTMKQPTDGASSPPVIILVDPHPPVGAVCSRCRRADAVIYGGAEAATTWEVIRDNKLAEPASRMFPPASAVPSTAISPNQLSESYRVATRYAMALALRVLHLGIAVQVIDGPTLTCLATWQRGATPLLTLNRAKLGAKWFAEGPTAAVNDLLIHEMAHQFGEHLTSKFDDAMSRIGADMVHLALTEPAFFKAWFQAAEGAATL